MGLIGSIAGGALGAAGSIFGGISASKAMKRVKKNLQAQKEANQNWYDRRYNEDATQRADAQRILTQTEESIRNRNRQAAGFAVLGAVDRIIGNRFGLGKEFEDGILAMGSLALAMLGIICLAPVLSNLLGYVVAEYAGDGVVLRHRPVAADLLLGFPWHVPPSSLFFCFCGCYRGQPFCASTISPRRGRLSCCACLFSP